MADVRIVGGDQNTPGGVVQAHVRALPRANVQLVALVNPSGDISWPIGSSGGGGGGPIEDGANASIKATVKDYANSKPLAVVLVNASGDAYNASSGGGSGGDGAINDGANSAIKATVLNDATAAPTASDKALVVQFADSPGRRVGRVSQDGAWAAAVTGDVQVVQKAGEDWRVRHQGPVGAQIVGGISSTVGISGDQTVKAIQAGAWALAISGDVLLRGTPAVQILTPLGVQVVGGLSSTVGISGDQLIRTQQSGAWAVAITGDAQVVQKAGEDWRVRHQGPIGAQVVGGLSSTVGISGDQSVKSIQSGARATAISGDGGVMATVRDYPNSNPIAVALTNASGDTYSPTPREPEIVTRAGRITAAGTTVIAGPYNGRVIKVTSIELQGETTNDTMLRLGSGASGDPISMRWIFNAREGIAPAVSQIGGGYIVKTNLNQSLVIEHFDTNPLNYCLRFQTGDSI